jgi:acyl-CoA thioester hydrolase
MTVQFTMHLPVRRYEVDQFGYVHNYIYQQYLEEVAIQASSDAGFNARWYDEHGTVWVVREITLDYLHPAHIDDELDISTWIADFRRVRSHREYEIRRTRDHQLLVRASADWVYIDRKTLWPTKIPAEAINALPAVDGRYAVPSARPIPALPATAAGREFRCRRAVQRHEVDGMGHVNNANYVIWFEQAVLDALNSWLPAAERKGWPCWRRHQIEYLSAVLPGEEVEIVSRLVGMGRARAAWYQEMRRPGSEQAAIKDSSVILYLDERWHPRPWPQELT